MKELHIRLSESETGDYQAEIIAPPLDAEDFDLPANPGWPCRLTLPSPLPDSNCTLADFQGYLLDLGQNDPDELKTIGGYLYDFLFGPLDPEGNGNVLYEYWDNCLHQSLQVQVDGVRTVLQLDSPSLIGVPWELCNLGGDYLAMQTPHTMLRTAWKAGGAFRREPVPLPGSNTREPLRMLLVISHRPDDVLVMGPDEALSVDKALFRLLPWMVDLHILIRPTFGELQEWCENWEPHILHYVGHGETTADGRPRLLLYERGMSDATPIDQDDMMNLFRRRVPRLVVLNACRSGQMGSVDMSMGAARATQSFSARLIQKGVLAVIAMQADIKGEDAVALVSDLYRELAKGKPIDQALTLAREHSFANGRNEGKWDWALPALYLAKGVRAEEVLHLDDTEAEPKVFPAIANNYHWLPLSMGVKIHVGREKEQLTLEKKVLAPDLADIAPITLLHGVQDMGKTTMLYWLSEGCARRGRPFIYADFARTSLNYWDVLRLIRDGRLETVSGVALHNHLPLDTDLLFNTFNDALNRKAIEHYAAEHPQQPESSTAVKDEAPDKNPISEMEKQGGVTIFSRVEQGVRADEKNLYETITEEFWSSLARAAEPNGLMIFLDHIDKLFPGTVEIMHKYLIDRLLTANSSSPVSKVRLVLAVRDADLTDVESLFEQNDAGKAWNFLFELAQKDGSQVREVRVEGLPHEQLHWLAQVWARRYFISCRAATPFKRFVDAYLGGRNLEPRHVDAYVKKRVDSYDPVPIAPGRLVTNLLDPQFIKDWLKTL